MTLAETQDAAIENGYSGKFPLTADCVEEWPTRFRCWWGRYGKCDDAGHCLAKEFAMKDGSHKYTSRREKP